jgi:hypothetical protein
MMHEGLTPISEVGMWRRRLSGQWVSASPHPPITSTPERASNGDVLSAGEGERVRDVKRHTAMSVKRILKRTARAA